MYTVKQVAALTGLPEATLRVWERRYAVVQPARSSGGYRLYDDEQVAVLREVAALVAAGVPASRAVTTVLDRPPTVPDPSRVPLDPDALEEAARSLDPQRLNQVVSTAFGSGPLEHVVSQWLQPQLERLGEAWESGRLSVDQEHFASAGLMRRLSARFDAAPALPDAAPGSPVVVGLPPNERHEMALLAFATCLRWRGIEVVYLGADVPVEAWASAVGASRARAAVVGITLTAEVDQAQAVVDRLRTLNPPVTVWAGGARREQTRDTIALPHDLAAAAARLQLALAAGLS